MPPLRAHTSCGSCSSGEFLLELHLNPNRCMHSLSVLSGKASVPLFASSPSFASIILVTVSMQDVVVDGFVAVHSASATTKSSSTHRTSNSRTPSIQSASSAQRVSQLAALTVVSVRRRCSRRISKKAAPMLSLELVSLLLGAAAEAGCAASPQAYGRIRDRASASQSGSALIKGGDPARTKCMRGFGFFSPRPTTRGSDGRKRGLGSSWGAKTLRTFIAREAQLLLNSAGGAPFSAGKAASARPQGPSKPPARVPRASDAVTGRFVALACGALPVKLAGRAAKASYTARRAAARGFRKPPSGPARAQGASLKPRNPASASARIGGTLPEGSPAGAPQRPSKRANPAAPSKRAAPPALRR
mmetsp:Transcript_11159/g.34393  ORF Transcript_11159/g.34393 Transcript_11159/m.34393 type:complete len:360 (-) Transcript_11159:1430-2509(-)